MADPKEGLDYWRKLFKTAEGDIFELIEKAIAVAAAEFPTEFKMKKSQIAEKLFTSLINGGDHPKEEIQIVGEVTKIKNLLSNNQFESDSALYESLSRLQLMKLSVETLMATEIGRTVRDLQNHNSNKIQKIVRSLIGEWKVLIDEGINSTLIDSINVINQQSLTDSNSPQRKTEKSEEVSYASELEMKKGRLRKGYERAVKTKKKRMV